MKAGMTLVDMAQELQRQADSKRDFIAPEQALTMDVVQTEALSPEVSLTLGEVGSFGLRPHAHGQIAQHLKIPKVYYDRMRADSPALLAQNVNHWLHQSDTQRMVRTLDGQARAYLSGKFRPLDHYDLADAVLPVLMDDGQVEIVSCAVTETKLYLKAVTERCQAEVQPGDVVQAGVVISNSEVGSGSLTVQPLLYRLICRNGAILNDMAMRKTHVGPQLAAFEERVEELLADETKALRDQALWHMVRDVVKGALDEAVFLRNVQQWHEATQQPITGDPAKVVEVTAQRLGCSQEERGGILRHLIEGADLSRYGLANAVTRMSQDVESYDRATDLERAGAQIIELPSHEWESLAVTT